MTHKTLPRINWLPNEDKPKRKRRRVLKKYDFEKAVINPKFVKVEGTIEI